MARQSSSPKSFVFLKPPPTKSFADVDRVLEQLRTAIDTAYRNLRNDIVANTMQTVAYLGDPDTDGSWRFTVSGTDLSIERRESGSWVNKDTVMA